MARAPRSPAPIAPLRGADTRPAIDRLRAIASQSADAIVSDGPVHPDHALLGACSEALRLLREAHDTLRAHHNLLADESSYAAHGEIRSIGERHRIAARAAANVLRAVTKMRSTTPAGIYAKALLVRQAPSGAPKLAASLAEELIAMPGLRASLWGPQALAGEAPQ